MENIEKILKQLHDIQPDPVAARNSRVRLMMAASQPQKMTFRFVLASMLRSGSAMVAVSLMLFFAIGGSVWNLIIEPATQFARWDSKTLLAEAQAIDTRIYLADLQYSDPGYERQRLISPSAHFNSIAIVADPKDAGLTVAAPSKDQDNDNDSAASSTDPAAPNPTSTPAEDNDDDAVNATSTLSIPAATSTTVGVKEALDILSR